MGLNLPRRRRRRFGTDLRLLGAMRPNHISTYDFIHDRLAGKRTIRLPCVLDEHTRECPAIEVASSIISRDVILTLTRLMRLYAKPQFIRSDQGAEFTATRVMQWLRDINVGPSVIPTGKPWHNGFVESFNGTLRDECLNREWLRDLRETRGDSSSNSRLNYRLVAIPHLWFDTLS